MRIARVAHAGQISWALLEGDSVGLLASAPYESGGVFGGGGITSSLALDDVRLLAPARPSKMLAVGRNFAAHAEEMGHEPGATPAVFVKLPTALIGPGDAVQLPPAELSDEVEYEAELALVIGRTCRNVDPATALDYVFGYTCADDVSARDLMRSDVHVTRGKNFDTFCPLGPWLETEVDPRQLDITCRVNGELRQSGNTRDHLFDVPTIVSELSRWTTLLPGDVVLTGSPQGRGRLAHGDLVEIDIESVGTLTHAVRGA